MLYVFIALCAYPVERGLFCLAMRQYKRWKLYKLWQYKRRASVVGDPQYAPQPVQEKVVALPPATRRAAWLCDYITQRRSNSGVLAPLDKPDPLATEQPSAFSLDACLDMAKETETKLRTVTGKL